MSVQSQIDEIAAGIATKETARAADLAAKAGAITKKAASPDKGGAGDKFASAAELGSKEAYSAIIKHQAGGDKDAIKDVAKTAKDQLGEAKKQTAALQKLAAASGSDAAVFSIA